MSNQAKWTPGPWAVDPRHQDEIVIEAIDPRDGQLFMLARVLGEESMEVRTPMSRANAHLIAAAPDLYEALIKLHSSIGVDDYGNRYADINDSMANEIENALAKARGES